MLFSKKNDVAAFEELASAHERAVYLTCYHMMGNREDALDCAQDAMLRAFRAFASFRKDAQFGTWIKRIAINTCIDALRKRKGEQSLDAMRDVGFEPVATLPTPYEQLEQKERIRLLHKALLQLPEDMHTLIVLRDMEGLAYDEIARLQDVPLGTVKSRISRAREKLSEILTEPAELFDSASV